MKKNSKKNCENHTEVENIIDILKEFYIIEIDNLSKKLENIDRINLESINAFIKEKKLERKSEIIKFIESIIQD